MQEDRPQIESETLAYARPLVSLKWRRLRDISIISFVIGIVSLLFAGAALIAAFHEAHTIKQEAAMRSLAYSDEFQDRTVANECFAAVGVGFGVCAILLIVGARSLHHEKSSGVAWLWAYVLLQLLCAAALSATTMWAIYHSPGGMLFYIGVIPGVLTAIYPLILIVLLLRASSTEE